MQTVVFITNFAQVLLIALALFTDISVEKISTTRELWILY